MALDNVLVDTYRRRFDTYLEIGWDKKSIKKYLADKANLLKIASFNTKTVSFSASSRRNRFYEVYNRADMSARDEAWGKCLKYLPEVVGRYDVHVIAARKVDVEAQTRDTLARVGFPVDAVTIHFLPLNTSLATYRRKTIQEIKRAGRRGGLVGVCLNPNQGITLARAGYAPVGFTSLADPESFEDFAGTIRHVAGSWKHLTKELSALHAQIQAQLARVPAPSPGVPVGTGTGTPKIAPAPGPGRVSGPRPAPASTSTPARAPAPAPTPAGGVQTQSMLEQAVYYQLFMGSNQIMGGSEHTTVRIPGVGPLLRTFMSDLKSQLPLILRDQLPAFFAHFRAKFPTDFSALEATAAANLALIGELEDQGFAGLFVVLTKFIELLREFAFDQWGLFHLKRLYEAQAGAGQFSEALETEVQDRYVRNDDAVALLYNLSFVAQVARSYPDDAVMRHVNKLIAFHAGVLASALAKGEA